MTSTDSQLPTRGLLALGPTSTSASVNEGGGGSLLQWWHKTLLRMHKRKLCNSKVACLSGNHSKLNADLTRVCTAEAVHAQTAPTKAAVRAAQDGGGMWKRGGPRGGGGKEVYLRKNLPDELLITLIITESQHQNLQQSHAVATLLLCSSSCLACIDCACVAPLCRCDSLVW